MLSPRSRAITDAHFTTEDAGELDALMATVSPDAVFEFHPMHLQLVGREAIREFYEHFVGHFRSRLRSFEIRERWESEDVLVLDHVLWVVDDAGTVRVETALGIITVDEHAVRGERVYLSEALLHAMAGPVLALMQPMPFSEAPA